MYSAVLNDYIEYSLDESHVVKALKETWTYNMY